VLRPYLLREKSTYCFSPQDSERKRRREQHAQRQTPLRYGNRPGTNRKSQPKRTPSDHYTKDSYARAVKRACELAKVAPWSPNRLRHSAATEIRQRFGLEAAQVTLGHAKADVTQVYAERDLKKAAEVMRQVG
jgi:integrase